jgi:hypothetical protein
MAEVEELNRDFIRDRERHAATCVPVGVTEAGITAFYPSRDYYPLLRYDAATIDRYVSTAEHTLVMVSINLMTGLPFNDLCAALEGKLRKAGDPFSATLSLLDPRRVDLMSVVAPVLNSDARELSQAIRRSVRDLVRFKSTLPTEIQEQFSVRVHPVLPFGSAILLDHGYPNGRIQIETKPYKAGLQKSFAFEVGRSRCSSGLYDVLSASFERLLRDGQPAVDESFTPEEA